MTTVLAFAVAWTILSPLTYCIGRLIFYLAAGSRWTVGDRRWVIAMSILGGLIGFAIAVVLLCAVLVIGFFDWLATDNREARW